jgi:hypothetical protein
LYDLAADPGETRNVAAQQPSRVQAMASLLAGIKAGRDRSPSPRFVASIKRSFLEKDFEEQDHDWQKH